MNLEKLYMLVLLRLYMSILFLIIVYPFVPLEFLTMYMYFFMTRKFISVLKKIKNKRIQQG